MQAICDSMLGNGTMSRPGACCKRDDDVAQGWCQSSAAAGSAHYASACDPTSPEFGTVNWAVAQGDLQVADARDWRQSEEESGFCELLGPVRDCVPPHRRSSANAQIRCEACCAESAPLA